MKILFITLSNVGDVILSLPALDSLLAAYPKAEVTVLCGERATGLFADNFYLKRCIVYDSSKGFRQKLRIFLELKKEVFDLLVDLKNSALPLLLKARHKTYPWFNASARIAHMRYRHLYKVQKFAWSAPLDRASFLFRKSLYISDKDRKVISNILDYEAGLSSEDKFIVVSPGARSHIKRWPADKFAPLCARLIEEFKIRVILVGDESDAQACAAVQKLIQQPVVNLCAKTSLKSLAALIERAQLVISNDSAVMHLASYLDRPTLAIFGPTDYKKYGPWANRSEVVYSKLGCSPCEVAQCPLGDALSPPLRAGAGLKCMKDIGVEEVYAAAKRLL